MEESKFIQLRHLSDMAYDKFEELYSSGALAELEHEIYKVASDLPKTFSISLELNVSVFDEEREKSLSLLTTGLASDERGKPYRTRGDATVHRYVVDGHIRLVPHDYCPHCWGIWDFKLLNWSCPECGYILGKQVKMLLDTDTCPYCEKGKVTQTNPRCTSCSFLVEPDIVVWG